jgi:cation diffusion facilitator family transporter
VVLIIGGILIIIHTIPEFLNPQPVNHQGVFWVAVGAIIINGFSVWLMSRGKSANEKLLNIHLFEDLFGWLAVLLMSIILNYTNWYILDPLLSIAIALWILYVTLPEFLRISKIFLQAVPDNINLKKLHDEIEAIDYVQVISHFHIWSTDGQQHMMTLTATTGSNSKEIQENIKQHIRHIVLKYDISHITIEILYDPDHLIKDSMMCEG